MSNDKQRQIDSREHCDR